MVPVDSQNSAIPGAIHPKIEENLSEFGRTTMQNFTPIGKAPAEKSVTIQNEWMNERASCIINSVCTIWKPLICTISNDKLLVISYIPPVASMCAFVPVQLASTAKTDT